MSSVGVLSIPVLLSYSEEKNKVEKRPILKGWNSLSFDELENYWDLCIDALEKFSSDGNIEVGIGVLTGRRSNLTVIDVDNINIFKEKLSEDLIQKLFAEASCVVRTARGGYHFYFAYCEELKQGTYQTHGFDVRNDGGFVVAPPSELVVDEKIFKWEWLKEDFENLKPVPLDILQALSQVGAVKWEGEEETKEEIYIDQEDLLELTKILKELWQRKCVNGYDIDTGFIGSLVKLGYPDEAIHELVEKIFEGEYSRKRTDYMINRVRERIERGIPYRGLKYLRSLLNSLLTSEQEEEVKNLAKKALELLTENKKQKNYLQDRYIQEYYKKLKVHSVEFFSRNEDFYLLLIIEGIRGLVKVEVSAKDLISRERFIKLLFIKTFRDIEDLEPPFKYIKKKKVYLFQWGRFVSFLKNKAKDLGERGEKEEKYDAVLRVISEAPVEDVFKEAGIFSIYYDKDKQRYYISLSSLLATIQNKLSLYGLHMNLKELVDYLYKIGAKPCRIKVYDEVGEKKQVRVWDITELLSKISISSISSDDTSGDTSFKKCHHCGEVRNDETSEGYTGDTSFQKCHLGLETRNDKTSEGCTGDTSGEKFLKFSDADNKIFNSVGGSVTNSLNARNGETFSGDTSGDTSFESVTGFLHIRNNGTSEKYTEDTSFQKCLYPECDMESVSFEDDEEELL